jgi:hypothetical protein
VVRAHLSNMEAKCVCRLPVTMFVSYASTACMVQSDRNYQALSCQSCQMHVLPPTHVARHAPIYDHSVQTSCWRDGAVICMCACPPLSLLRELEPPRCRLRGPLRMDLSTHQKYFLTVGETQEPGEPQIELIPSILGRCSEDSPASTCDQAFAIIGEKPPNQPRVDSILLFRSFVHP